IVVMVSLGLGMNRAFEQQLEAYGSLTTITVYGGRDYGYMESTSSSGSGSEDQVTLDAETTAEIESLDYVKTVVGFKNFNAMLYAGKYMGWTSIKAVDFDKLSSLDIELSEGTLPTKDGQYEVLMGYQVPYNFYDPNSRDPYGSMPQIDVFSDKIELLPSTDYYDGKRPKGFVITPTGLTSEDDYDYAWYVFVDYDTYLKMQEDFARKNRTSDQNGDSRNNRDEDQSLYDELRVDVDDIDHVQGVQEIIKSMGFEAYSLTDALESMKQFSSLVQAVLGGIGGVSLFIAAIGITNTMVMSIYERTKEIGVMKVIGAQLKDIKRLFLFEAAMIGFFGGILGIGISYGISFIVNSLLSGMSDGSGYYGFALQSYIPLWLALTGVGFSTLIGLIAGYYPAVRATRLSALEAIRTE
ncbi:MAG: hypothetical protein PWQ12_2033, partial [Clostridiales bacterium]|nr:hypothetical protein [Clostridiales bacterium]